MILNYNEFKEQMAENIVHWLPEQYQNSEVRIEQIPKINGSRESLGIHNGTAFVPNLYLEECYKSYLKSLDLDRTIEEAAEYYLQASTSGTAITGNLAVVGALDRIILVLVETERNRDLLAGVPHREFLDLSIFYRWLLPSGDGSGMQLMTVTNEMAEQNRLTEGDLFSLAYVNSRRLLPERSDELGEGIIVISNREGLLGASVMVYGDKIREIAEELRSDLFILPTSLHEVIVIPVEMHSPKRLLSLIRDANQTVLKPEDILSDSLYRYDRYDGRISRILREEEGTVEGMTVTVEEKGTLLH